jgi:hypothetical protein
MTTGKSKDYATEYIYELYILRMYLDWLQSNFRDEAGSVATCDTVKSVFTKKSTNSNSVFNTITPIDKLAGGITCFGAGCPTDNRKGEFFILDQNVNAMKAIVLGEMTEKAELKDLRCEKAWRSNKAKLATLSAVFQHIQMEEVAKVFVKVNGRMRDVLTSPDADPYYNSFKPLPQKVSDVDEKVAEIKHYGWLGAYDYFMSMFLYAS